VIRESENPESLLELLAKLTPIDEDFPLLLDPEPDSVNL
jgi:hypothetical protein